ncbi:MAG: SDR family oxidoreductase [Pseudomonadales bacterium]|nr:SDR family oxidoreductase [Pseudomonadales bacterium]
MLDAVDQITVIILEGIEMTQSMLGDKRILLTHAHAFMGPYLQTLLTEMGAHVIADEGSLMEADAPARLVERAGEVDILIANLSIPAPSSRLAEVSDEEWRDTFAALVDPLPRLARAVVPKMKAQGHGKILVMGSASALRGMKRASSYSAARGAQLAWAQAAGVELAADNIQVNAIAQNFVDNPTYFPESVQQDPRFQERLKREVPLGRLVTAKEDAQFVAYLCSDAANCFVAQVFPLCGGWVQR